MILFSGIKCEVDKGRYENGQVRLQLLVAPGDPHWTPGDPVATATCCIPGWVPGENETAIKDCGENQGVLAALVKAGVVSKPIGKVLQGYEAFPVVEVLI